MPKGANVSLICILERPVVFPRRFLRLQEALKHFLVANGIFPPLLLLRLLDVAQVANALDFRAHLLVALLRHLIVNHLALGFRVFHPAQLLQLPGLAHVQVGAIQVVLAHLVIVVEYGELVMLLRLEAELDVRVILPGSSICPADRAILAVIALLDVFCKVRPDALHELTRDLLLLVLRPDELLVEGVLFLANRIDAVEVIHVADRARTAPRVYVELTLAHRRDLLTDVAAVVTGAEHIDLGCGRPRRATPTAVREWCRLIVLELRGLGRWIEQVVVA